MRTKIRETKFYCKDFLEIYLYPVTEQVLTEKNVDYLSELSAMSSVKYENFK